MVRAQQYCMNALEFSGFHVEAVSDMERGLALAERLWGEVSTPVISSGHNDFTAGRFFWLILHDERGPAACAAARLEDLGGEDPSAYLHRSMSRHYLECGRDVVKSVAPREVLGLGDRLAYIGGLNFRKDVRGGKNSLMAFMGLLQMLVATQWHVDNAYAFVSPRDGRLLVGRTYGFMTEIPQVVIWKEPPPGRYEDECFLSISRGQFPHLADQLVSRLGREKS